jgi:uncharacterized protein YceK
MKKLILWAAIAVMALTAGCAAITGSNATTQSAQVSYVQACAAYDAAFNAALQARAQGKLNPAQISQVNLIDAQITPICTGPLPADPVSATNQITTAVTTLAIMEAVKK